MKILMKTSVKVLGLTSLAALVFSPAARAQTSSTFAGNGLTGFGGPVGNGSLTVSADDAGMLTFSAANGAGTTNFNGNSLVVYIDSGRTGGFASTAGLTDPSTDMADGSHEAVSGVSANASGMTGATQTVAAFAPGFNASYAVVFDGTGVTSTYLGNVILFSLGTGGSINYVTSAFVKTADNYTLTFPAADLGLGAPGTNSFNLEGTLIADAAYRSNETIGTSVTVPGTTGDTPNAGFVGTTTFSTSDTFAFDVVPEPSTTAFIGLAAAALAGFGWLRTRRQA